MYNIKKFLEKVLKKLCVNATLYPCEFGIPEITMHKGEPYYEKGFCKGCCCYDGSNDNAYRMQQQAN